MTDKTEKVTVCVTAEYDKTKKQIISGNEDVKITVGNTKVITSVAEAVKKIGELSATGAPNAPADSGVGATGDGAVNWC